MGDPNAGSRITERLNYLAKERAQGNTAWVGSVLSRLGPSADLVDAFNALASFPIAIGAAAAARLQPAETGIEQNHLIGGDFEPETKTVIMQYIRMILATNAPATYQNGYGSQRANRYDVEKTTTVVNGQVQYTLTFRKP